MTTHVALPDRPDAACGATDGEVVWFDEAMSDGGRHFDCVACHKVLTDGQRHSRSVEELQ